MITAIQFKSAGAKNQVCKMARRLAEGDTRIPMQCTGCPVQVLLNQAHAQGRVENQDLPVGITEGEVRKLLVNETVEGGFPSELDPTGHNNAAMNRNKALARRIDAEIVGVINEHDDLVYAFKFRKTLKGMAFYYLFQLNERLSQYCIKGW